ncbi:MAG: hypothetical protein LBR86_03010, partial [Tannerella sp.]|nr:hypothetical protein [Tannerella sp.]
MKNDFTRRNRRLALRAVKLKVTRAGYVLLAGVMLCMAFAALQPLSAADDVGNAKQAIGHQLYFGNFPQNYEGWNTLVEAAMATVPHVKKINYRAQAPKTPDGRDSFYVGFFSVQPVEWRVLADDAEGILLLSEQILTQWPYHTSGGPVTWQGASVRDSLKYRFLLGNTLLGGGKDYFSPTEIDAVATSTLQN